MPGYTASGEVPSIVVTPETQSSKVNITYTANDGTQTIIYQDGDGSEIGKQVISGKTDEKVKVTPDVPDGYVLKGEVPSKVTIKPDDTPITVTVEHGKSHVTPDKPVNKGDLIPDTKDKHYPEGLTHNDLNKTVTREITIIDPTGKKSTTTQTVTFTRGATVDEVTNKVTYDDWSENGKHTFDKVDVPTVQGYTASGEVPSIVVTPTTQSSKIEITYTKNETVKKDDNKPVNDTTVIDNAPSVVPSSPTIALSQNSISINEDNNKLASISVDTQGKLDSDHLEPNLLRNNKRNAVNTSGNSHQNGDTAHNINATINTSPANSNVADNVVVTPATIIASQPASNSKANKLPQTGNKDNYAIVALGLVNLATSLALIGAKKRKRS